ncbi:BTAD domain-containing putative transcriptional regulator [Longispora fulva]|uniref:Putative ATPase/DNA-binding SARP family transcriptional activator n=1 Tax=Longispora fulva TaxID=619741 RepID=A0A8J7KKB0_9ACTN|nr:BTAD domain-containing putative transcriptional regulator [Longispora fulva]MBG6137854.1 putative ATPase/DNA-binding SARP family transcriptional activator [Longispora fulva]
MSIAILGPLEVEGGTVRGARLRTLLVLLALEPGRVVTAGRLADALWGSEPPAEVTNALQALVSRLRRAVPTLDIRSHPAGYQLRIAPDAVDARRFEALAAAGRAVLDTDPAGALALLREALGLWRGPALADVADADFALAPVARLAELRLAAVEDRVAAELRTEVGPGTVAELEGLVVEHPVRESLTVALIRVLVAVGRPGAALAAFERTRAALADRLGADPSPALAGAHLAVLRAEPAPAPAVTLLTNLRAGLTSFVGRDADLDRVGGLLADARLVTLTGPGGAGKTRLAGEAAARQLGRSPGGVWMVELAPVTDETEVPQTILAALGLREQALHQRRRTSPDPADLVGRLVEGLTGKDMLLVLDNCEHVIDTVAAVTDRLLGECPRLRVLATSREPLGITGETLWPVESLDLPPDADADPGRYAAVRLFADRAAAARPDFALDPGTAPAVVRICRALDGMPLAIELAAARLRSMSVEQVAGRLGDRFRLLTAGSRTALPRHQTLRAVVDWSWELLADDERDLWRSMAVFAGGATLEAVEGVCGGPGAADLVGALVDKSILVPVDGTRYRMLETIREYGLDRLADHGDADRFRRAHATYFLALAEEAESAMRGRDQVFWLARLSEEHDNLHGALRWSIAAGDADIAVRMVAALGWYWGLRGHRVEGSALALDALALPGGPPASRALAHILGALNVAEGTHDAELALSWLNIAADMVAVDSSLRATHPLLRIVGPVRSLFAERDGGTGMADLREVFEDPDPWLAAAARVAHAFVSFNLGLDHETAQADSLASLDTFRRLGDRWGASLALSAVAEHLTRNGDYRAAAEAYAESAQLTGELGAFEDLPQFQTRQSEQWWLAGEPDLAWRTLADARRAAERAGLVEGAVAVELSHGLLAKWEGRLDESRAALERCEALIFSPRVSGQIQALVLAALASLDIAVGDLPAAESRLRLAYSTAMASRDTPVVATVLVTLAELAVAVGDPARAALLLGVADQNLGIRGPVGPDAVAVAEAARAVLGERFAEHYQRGRDRSTHQILTEVTSAA